MGGENHEYTFKHFTPIGDTSIKGITKSFSGPVDVFNLKKNIPHFEEVATQVGLGLLKGAITKNTLQFFQNTDQVKKPSPQFKQAQENTMPVLGYGELGFPIYSNLIISADSYQDNQGNVIGKFDEIRLDCVIIEMDNENNLVTTDIQGRNTTIIEYISSKSWTINITGRLLAKQPGVYPQEDVSNLITALNSNKALRITSWFLNMAGIYQIAIKKKSIHQEEGSQEYQKFDFEAIADRPVLLKLIQ